MLSGYHVSQAHARGHAVIALQKRNSFYLMRPSSGCKQAPSRTNRLNFPRSKGLVNVIFVCAQPCSTTLFGVPFPLPTPQGAGIGNSGTSPRPRFESCARQPSGHRATSANLFRKECQVCNEARKPSCPASHIQSSGAIDPKGSRACKSRGSSIFLYCKNQKLYHFLFFLTRAYALWYYEAVSSPSLFNLC